jgi:DNA topoisomerase-1
MLRYVDDTMPGISRRRHGRYWQYFDHKGKRIANRDEIDRLNAIGMPPAYVRCWFCPDPDGHIQAIGYDARGRRQYRYHPDFRARQDKSKYARLADFGRALPKLRKQVAADIKGKATEFEAVVAAVVRLIDETHMRVGNEDYARTNKSFGATTLRNRHARIGRGRLEITYPAKHGIRRTVTISDRHLARIARKTHELPGQHLFEFVDDEGAVRPVGSADVNAYIRDAMGEDFSAKDFRTWGASVIAFEALATQTASGLNGMIAPVAEALGNTVAISRKSYVHPALIEIAKAPGAPDLAPLPRPTKHLSAAEHGFLAFLRSKRPKVAKTGARR